MSVPQAIARYRAEISRLCERHGVQKLELFGSATGETFDPKTSDVDFLVEFGELEPGTRADAYFGLLEELQALLDRHVDLVMTRAIRNRYFLESIESTRTTLYAA